MSAKKSKLEQQFKLEAQLSGVKKNIFDGISIFVNGYSSTDIIRTIFYSYVS